MQRLLNFIEKVIYVFVLEVKIYKIVGLLWFCFYGNQVGLRYYLKYIQRMFKL